MKSRRKNSKRSYGRSKKSVRHSKGKKHSRKVVRSKKVQTRIEFFKKWWKKKEPELSSPQKQELSQYIQQECKIRRKNSLSSPEDVYKYRECEQEVRESKLFKLLLGSKQTKVTY